MGCGASVQSGTAPLQVQRDPSDFNLEYIELVPVGIVEFDGTFSTVEQVLNRVVELNNDVNDCLADIKAAYAVCADALQIDTRVGVPDHDRVLLSLCHKDGSTTTPQEIQQLMTSNQAACQADHQLEQARQVLHGALCLQQVALQISLDGQSVQIKTNPAGVQRQQQGQQQPSLPELDIFNAALTAFRMALPANYKIGIAVKPALAPGAPTAEAVVLKREVGTGVNSTTGWQAASSGVHARPATLLEVLSAESAARIKEAELAVADRAVRLALVTRDLHGAHWQVLRKHKVTLAVALPDPQQRAQVRKALVETNHALFKLVNAAAGSKGYVSLALSVAEIARQWCLVARAKWTPLGGLPASLKSVLKFMTRLNFKEAGIFEFEIDAEAAPQVQLPPFPACLPVQGQELFMRVESLNATIRNALEALPGIASQLDPLVEQARHFYELVPEAAAQRGMPMMEAVKAGKAVGANLKMLFDSQELFQALTANIKRVADDLSNAQGEVQHVMDVQAAEAGIAPKPSLAARPSLPQGVLHTATVAA